MCGLIAVVDYEFEATNELMVRMLSSLDHRGPDDQGVQFLEFPQCKVGLGHRRLSIQDLSTLGRQPMSYKGFTIVFNGEVYNFKEIRDQLRQLGYSFETATDTEVVLKSFHCWGSECVEQFRGMFAFAIVDSNKSKLHLIRDRAGVKPLYYYRTEKLLIAASELKAIVCHPRFKRELDLSSVLGFLKFGYVPQPNSIFQNVRKIRPGHILVLDLKSAASTEHRYWSILDYYAEPKLECGYEVAKSALENKLNESFALRMISDAPIGVFLSGGYDSTAVASMLQKGSSDKIKTFTIGFESAEYDEAPHAREIADYIGTEHREYYCTSDDAIGVIEDLSDVFDEPFGDVSAIPTVLISKLASQEVKVVLSADGGDELFAGYTKYYRITKFLRAYDSNAAIRVLARMCLSVLSRFSSEYGSYMRAIETLERKPSESALKYQVFPSNRFIKGLLLEDVLEPPTLFDEEPSSDVLDDVLSRLQAVDFETYLVDDVLTKVDRATMFASIEGREPLLDHKIAEYVAQLPTEFKRVGSSGKKILKDIVHQYVPKELLDRPKKGFDVPIGSWLSGRLSTYLDRYLGNEFLTRQAVFDSRKVTALVNTFKSNPSNKSIARLIWHLLVFQLWYERWMTQP